MFLGMSNEIILQRIDINVGDCSFWKLVSKLSNGFFQSFVEELCHIVEGRCTAYFVNLCSSDGKSVHDVRVTTNWTSVMYPE